MMLATLVWINRVCGVYLMTTYSALSLCWTFFAILLSAVSCCDTALRGASAAEGNGRVGEVEFPNLKDGGRDGRPVPIKVHYPRETGTYPLVVFSHGGMGTWDSHLYEAQHLAGNGYVVLCLEHVYSNNVKSKEHIRKAKGTLRQRIDEALMRITTDPQAVLQRPRDVSFAIDMAIRWNEENSRLRGSINTKKIAVVGHSFGAYTVLAVCGARPILDYLKPAVDPGKGLSDDLSDPRVTVGVAMSPQGPGTSRFAKESYKTINRPLLCFSGSKDVQFGHDGTHQPALKRLEAFKLMPPGEKYYLWLDSANHFAFADNPKAFLFPSVARRDTQRIVKAMTLAFCDAYLKNSKAARERLTEDYANSQCGNVVKTVTWYQK